MSNGFEFVIGSEKFCQQMQADVSGATKLFWVQTLSFEADSGGDFLSELMQNTAIKDRRLILDKFYRFIISDKIIYSIRSLLDKKLQQEIKATRNSIKYLSAKNVLVREVNPLGFVARKFCRRNHKKIICVDDAVAYIGGINFSEHNFSWHDFMLRITDPESIAILKNDFENTCSNNSQSYIKPIQDGFWLSVTGNDNEKYFSKIIEMIDNAKSFIRVHSPYLSSPFVDALNNAAKRGVRIDFITAAQSNWQLFNGYLRYVTRHKNFHTHPYLPNFSHVKAMQIDNDNLILGSCNFDYYSYHNHAEIMLVSHNKQLISDFEQKIWQPDLTACGDEWSEHNKKDYIYYLLTRATMYVTSMLAFQRNNNKDKNKNIGKASK